MKRLFLPCAVLACIPTQLSAQESETIDILVPPEDYQGPLEDCSAEQEAASISGQIVVCRRKPDNARYGYDKKAAEQRYATKTMHKGDPQAPDVEGRNVIPMVGAGASFRGCFIPPCPPPKALIIDVEALPEATPGSDADRLARGLPPLGRDAATAPVTEPRPEPAAMEEEAVSPSESASPAEEPSG